ncbi:MAG: hypothetical protein DCE90_00010 [Pseudanabaena sp.]|nr:MAG: hypothetical protein DCE90_00010 [Pseudanabaena sp.]
MTFTENVKKVTPNNRYIVAKSGEKLITFPDLLVAEIMIIERNSILPLPFYKPAIIGVVHYQASIIPLLLLRLVLGEQRALLTESLTLIKLSEVANELGEQRLAGIGVIVDRVVGSLTISEYHEYQQMQSRRSSSPNPRNKFADNLNNFDVSSDFSSNSSKKVNQTVANIEENEYTPIEIVLSVMLDDVWQPQRWQTSK